jgi:hypothetical protein
MESEHSEKKLDQQLRLAIAFMTAERGLVTGSGDPICGSDIKEAWSSSGCLTEYTGHLMGKPRRTPASWFR